MSLPPLKPKPQVPSMETPSANPNQTKETPTRRPRVKSLQNKRKPEDISIYFYGGNPRFLSILESQRKAEDTMNEEVDYIDDKSRKEVKEMFSRGREFTHKKTKMEKEVIRSILEKKKKESEPEVTDPESRFSGFGEMLMNKNEKKFFANRLHRHFYMNNRKVGLVEMPHGNIRKHYLKEIDKKHQDMEKLKKTIVLPSIKSKHGQNAGMGFKNHSVGDEDNLTLGGTFCLGKEPSKLF